VLGAFKYILQINGVIELKLSALCGERIPMIEVNVDRNDPGVKLKHFWSVCVGAGRANEGLRAGWLEQLRKVREHCGFQYVRFHGLFHDDMFVYRQENGRSIYNFQYIDDLFDRLLDIDVRPFVELGFCPGDLATEKNTIFWWKGHGSPPKDNIQWAELIDRTVRHWIDRYGLDEVRRWYFEIWNEPNLNPFFKGTKSQYFELYKISVNAVKSIDPLLRVGGPATSNFVPDARFDGETEDFSQHQLILTSKDLDALDWRPVWLAQFLDYCHRENLPLDFVSCHPYPTDWSLDSLGQTIKKTRSVDATPKDLALLRKMIDASPYPNAEIHLTEWSSSPSPRDYTHDYLQAATFVVKANLESINLVDSLSYWTFTDIFEESGAGDTLFHGGFGMINYQGIVKPTFHAYRFLHALGDEVLARTPGVIVTRHSSTRKIIALAYHYPIEMPLSVPASFDSPNRAEEVLAMGHPFELRIELSGFTPHAQFAIETLDKQHGNALSAWRDLGRPESPTRRQTTLLQQAAHATHKESANADALGKLSLARSIQPWSIVLVSEM
jgi:xylan 1,4-beta-xylosidase